MQAQGLRKVVPRERDGERGLGLDADAAQGLARGGFGLLGEVCDPVALGGEAPVEGGDLSNIDQRVDEYGGPVGEDVDQLEEVWHARNRGTCEPPADLVAGASRAPGDVGAGAGATEGIQPGPEVG